MKPEPTKDTVFNSLVLFAAWMVVISTCMTDDIDTGTQVVRIAYQPQ
jgi:hypothetical protein